MLMLMLMLMLKVDEVENGWMGGAQLPARVESASRRFRASGVYRSLAR